MSSAITDAAGVEAPNSTAARAQLRTPDLFTRPTVRAEGHERRKSLAPVPGVCEGSGRNFAYTKETHMGLLDKIKGLLGGNKKAAKDGVDKVADVVQSKTPDSVDDKVEMAADKVKDVIESVDGDTK